ncbi:MAG: type VI secretion system lipoprotein TssJ [Planctomycetes bacterium]|nr:type VI secretion system lipoprotein TssJ [Planctomycetota bacterium]
MKTRAILLLVLTLVLSACGGTSSIRVHGISPLNKNEAGESTPVDVRIYLLRNDGKFMSAPYDQLWTADKDALGADAVGDHLAITVFPSEAGDKPKEVSLGTLAADVKFIGVMALYPKSEDKGERRVVVPVGDAPGYVFEFTGYRIQLKK